MFPSSEGHVVFIMAFMAVAAPAAAVFASAKAL